MEMEGLKANEREDQLQEKVNLTMEDATQNPVTNKTQSFYYFKFQSFQVLILKARLEKAEKLMQKKKKTRNQITKILEDRKLARDKSNSQLEYQLYKGGFKHTIFRKMDELKHLQRALVDRCQGRAKPETISSLEELNNLKKIKKLQCQLRHGNSNRTKEKRLLKEIKQAEEKRKIVAANAPEQPLEQPLEVPIYMNSNKAIRNRIKVLGIELEELREKELDRRVKIQRLYREMVTAEDSNSYHKKLLYLNQEITEAYKIIIELKYQIDHVDV